LKIQTDFTQQIQNDLSRNKKKIEHKNIRQGGKGRSDAIMKTKNK
jgi:hypothetical protein